MRCRNHSKISFEIGLLNYSELVLCRFLILLLRSGEFCEQSILDQIQIGSGTSAEIDPSAVLSAMLYFSRNINFCSTGSMDPCHYTHTEHNHSPVTHTNNTPT